LASLTAGIPIPGRSITAQFGWHFP
jgi:hypothetical protein